MCDFVETTDKLFRGKRCDNGEWVIGHLLAEDIIVPVNTPFVIFDKNVIYYLDVCVVHSNTVGQFTGLRDKHDVPIYEGDIVMKRTYHGKKPMRVVFSSGCFHCGWGGGSSTAMHPYTLEDKQIEVIGNVFDHHELLEE